MLLFLDVESGSVWQRHIAWKLTNHTWRMSCGDDTRLFRLVRAAPGSSIRCGTATVHGSEVWYSLVRDALRSSSRFCMATLHSSKVWLEFENLEDIQYRHIWPKEMATVPHNVTITVTLTLPVQPVQCWCSSHEQWRQNKPPSNLPCLVILIALYDYVSSI